MSSRPGTGRSAARRPVIVLAGEDSHDRQCLRLVIEDLCPAAQGRIVEINKTVRLCAARQETLAQRIAKLVDLAKARAARERSEIGGLFVHEDYDQVDSSERAAARARVQAALESRILGHYILATWEIEAWLLLFPAALQAHTKAWSVPKKYLKRDTGRIADPKKVLQDEVARGGHRYRESDSPRIIQKAIELSLLRSPAGSNQSWAELVDGVESWCSSAGANSARRGPGH